MSSDELIKICSSKMKKAYEIFCQELASLRTGRANASMLDIIKVDVYGQKMPINQLATISTPDPRSISVQVWDQNNVNLIDSANKIILFGRSELISKTAFNSGVLILFLFA